MKEMEFKYQEDYKLLMEKGEICPPATYKPKNISPAYRWVLDPIETPSNWLSQYHKDPIRFAPKNGLIQCEAMALSFFSTENGCKLRFNELKKLIGVKVSNMGTHIAEGQIFEKDGVNSEEDENSHFNHHSAIEANYIQNFLRAKLI